MLGLSIYRKCPYLLSCKVRPENAAVALAVAVQSRRKMLKAAAQRLFQAIGRHADRAIQIAIHRLDGQCRSVRQAQDGAAGFIFAAMITVDVQENDGDS